MATLRSTVNAPLTDDEEDRILTAWADILEHADTLVRVPRTDTVGMLNAAADMVGLISQFRTAVSNGWHYANKRAFSPKHVAQILAAQDLATPEYTDEQIKAALKELFT